jgi:hypothetical protein
MHDDARRTTTDNGKWKWTWKILTKQVEKARERKKAFTSPHIVHKVVVVVNLVLVLVLLKQNQRFHELQKTFPHWKISHNKKRRKKEERRNFPLHALLDMLSQTYAVHEKRTAASSFLPITN